MAHKSKQQQIRYKKRLLSRKIKKHKIEIITRKSQPQPIIMAEVMQLKEQEMGGPVSSSWITAVEWNKDQKCAFMSTKQGYIYAVFVPFKVFEAWYYAHSKGTFFNERVRDKFTVERTTIGASWRKQGSYKQRWFHI